MFTKRIIIRDAQKGVNLKEKCLHSEVQSLKQTFNETKNLLLFLFINEILFILVFD